MRSISGTRGAGSATAVVIGRAGLSDNPADRSTGEFSALHWCNLTIERTATMMTAMEFVHSELTRIHTIFDQALDGLTSDQMHAVPGGTTKANTIAWEVWHCVRTEDNIVRFVLQNRRS